MSNDPSADPVGHAAKFLAIFALIPAIFGLIPFLAPEAARNTPEWAKYNGLILAAVFACIGLGVHRRSILVARLGMGLLALILVALVVGGIYKRKPGAAVFFGVLFVWPIIKLRDAAELIKAEATSE